jgi:murein L,D-transpeptidase YafK
MMLRIAGRFMVAALAFGLLAACNDPQINTSNMRHWIPLTPELLAAMQEKAMRKEDPILIRTYKQEAVFEVWKKDTTGRYALLKSFPMCRWSGQLGPKRKEGDRQAPEGYYAITPAQMNPNSNYHLSYDMGYPNAYDRAHGGTGSYLMVHGDCSSAGCYSMTDKEIEEIYALVREAHSGGQKAVQMEAFPFRFTAVNLARHRLDPNMPFWRELKEGADRFEITRQEPKVDVCNGHYSFDRVARSGEAAGCGTQSDPELAKQVADKEREDAVEVAALVRDGVPAVRLAYDDGGQNPSFKFKSIETSRPETISEGPTVELFNSKGALTKVAVRARGFDEESIAAAVKDVGSPATSATMVASGGPAEAKPASTTTASVSGSASASSKGTASTSATVIVANSSARSSASVVARHDAAPATDAHTALAAFVSPAPGDVSASPNKDQSFYQRLLAKLPFSASNEAQDRNGPSEADAQNAIDPQAPLPPARPASLSRSTGPRLGSPQASVVPGFDLLSPHTAFAALPSFIKGSPVTSPTTATGFAPAGP